MLIFFLDTVFKLDYNKGCKKSTEFFEKIEFKNLSFKYFENAEKYVLEDINLKIVYVKASDKTRLLRQLNREEEPNVHEIVRRFYTDEADFQDDKSFITLGNDYFEIWNDDRIGQE